MRETIRTLWVGLLLGVALGCTEDEPCDPKTELVGTVCLPKAVDAATVAMDAAPSDAQAAPNGNFGATCMDNPQCTGGADYCAKMPGQPSGYCTATGCDKDPGKCPAGWSCFNLGMFSPGLPHMCLKP